MTSSKKYNSFIRLLSFLILHSFATHGWFASACKFPWVDTWLENERVMNITHHHFGNLGQCQDRINDKFLLVSPTNRGNCYRCLLAFPVHYNVLQYKITRCIYDDNMTIGECQKHLNNDVDLHTMFKKDAPAMQCPLRLPLSFVYHENHKGTCQSRRSSLSRCAEWNRLALNFQACPENPKREATMSEMECIGTWQTNGQQFFAARLITLRGEEHRCFIHDTRTSSAGSLGISADSGCQELTHIRDATMTLHLKQEAEIISFCEFPSYFWKHEHKKWKHDWKSMAFNNDQHIHRGSWHSYYRHKNDTVWTCLDRKDRNSDHYFRTYVQKDCLQGYQCIRVKRLRKHLIEVEYGPILQEEFLDCTEMVVERRDTLIMPGHKEPCAPRGRLFTPSCPDRPAVSIGCGHDNLHKLKSCDFLETESFECLAHFEDSQQRLTVIRSEETGQLMCMAHITQPINLVRIFDSRACHPNSIEGEPPNVFINISKTDGCDGSRFAGFLSSRASALLNYIPTIFSFNFFLVLYFIIIP